MQERGNDKGAGTILVLCSSILLTTPLFFRAIPACRARLVGLEPSVGR